MSALPRTRRARDADVRWGRPCPRKWAAPHDAFRRWLEATGVPPDQARTVAAAAVLAEHWLCEHRLSILGANDGDLAAFKASPLGAALGDAGLEALMLLKRWGQEELPGWAGELGG